MSITAPGPAKRRLEEEFRETIRVRGYSIDTERSYWMWARQFITQQTGQVFAFGAPVKRASTRVKVPPVQLDGSAPQTAPKSEYFAKWKAWGLPSAEEAAELFY